MPQKGSITALKSEDKLIDQGTKSLLSAIKKHAEQNGSPLKRTQLIKEGYSERFIAKVEKA